MMYDSKTINTAKFLTNSKQLKNESISHYEINFERKKVYQILNEEILKGNSEIENIFTLKNENIINMLRTNIQLFDPHSEEKNLIHPFNQELKANAIIIRDYGFDSYNFFDENIMFILSKMIIIYIDTTGIEQEKEKLINNIMNISGEFKKGQQSFLRMKIIKENFEFIFQIFIKIIDNFCQGTKVVLYEENYDQFIKKNSLVNYTGVEFFGIIKLICFLFENNILIWFLRNENKQRKNTFLFFNNINNDQQYIKLMNRAKIENTKIVFNFENDEDSGFEDIDEKKYIISRDEEDIFINDYGNNKNKTPKKPIKLNQKLSDDLNINNPKFALVFKEKIDKERVINLNYVSDFNNNMFQVSGLDNLGILNNYQNPLMQGFPNQFKFPLKNKLNSDSPNQFKKSL